MILHYLLYDKLNFEFDELIIKSIIDFVFLKKQIEINEMDLINTLE